MQRKGSLSGKMFAWCILQRRFAGHFEYMGSISCQSQLILDAWRRYLAMKRRYYRPRLLREYIRAIFCQECGLSSAWSALRGCFIQRMRLHLPEMGLEKVPSRNAPFRYPKCTSKMLRPGPFGCAGEGEMIIAVFSLRQSVSSVPWGFGRCGAAELRAPDVAVDANGGGAGGA